MNLRLGCEFLTGPQPVAIVSYVIHLMEGNAPMKTLLASIALVISNAGTASAQSMQTPVGVVKKSETSLLVSEMIGEPI